jgi:hypothetical protein
MAEIKLHQDLQGVIVFLIGRNYISSGITKHSSEDFKLPSEIPKPSTINFILPLGI